MKRSIFLSLGACLSLALAACGPKPHGKNAGAPESVLSKTAKADAMAKPTQSWIFKSQNCATSGETVANSFAPQTVSVESGAQVALTLEITQGIGGDGGRLSEVYSAGDNPDCKLTVNGGFEIAGSEIRVTVVSLEGAALAKKACGLTFKGAPGDVMKYEFQSTPQELTLSQPDSKKFCKTGEKISSHFTL